MNWFARHPIAKYCAFVLLAALVAITLAWLQPDELARYKNQLAESGEELSLVKLSPPRSQAVVDFLESFRVSTEKISAGPIVCGALDYMSKPTNGFTVPLWTLREPGAPGKGSWDDLARQTERSGIAFAEIRQLIANPPSGASYDAANPLRPTPINILVSKRRAAQGLAGAVVSELNQQNLPAAITNLDTLIALASLYDPSYLLVDYMIQVSIAGLAISATWESLQAPGWTESQLAELQNDLLKLDFAPRLAHVIEMVRAYTVTYCSICRTNSPELRQLLLGFSNSSAFDRIQNTLSVSLWASMWSKGDELRFLQNMQPLVEGTRRASAHYNYQELHTAFTNATAMAQARSSRFDRFRFPISSFSSQNWVKAARSVFTAETRRQMALAAVALNRHQLKHGKLPADFSALIPEFLAALPRDFLGNSSLIFQRLSDEQFTLQSLGEDGQQDLGSGDDLFWPAAQFNLNSAVED